MKKLWILALVICLLAGCTTAKPDTTASSQPTTNPTTQPIGNPTETTIPTSPSTPDQEDPDPTPPPTDVEPPDTSPDTPITFLLYHPNEEWIELETVELTMDTLDPHLLIQYLIDYGVLDEGVALNSAQVDNGQLNLDLNNAFLMQIYSMGTLGEALLMGSLVNTFFSAYECDSMMVTVDGEIIHSGHVDYDFPMYPSN